MNPNAARSPCRQDAFFEGTQDRGFRDGVVGLARGTPYLKCRIWYSTSRTVSDDDVHRLATYDRSARAFAVKPRAFGAPQCGVGA